MNCSTPLERDSFKKNGMSFRSFFGQRGVLQIKNDMEIRMFSFLSDLSSIREWFIKIKVRYSTILWKLLEFRGCHFII